MASLEEVPASKPSDQVPQEAGEKEEETLAASEGEKKPSLPRINGDSTNGGGAGCSSGLEEKDSKNILERAAELFDKGSKAIEGGDFVDAVDCLSRALEIRVAHFGELAPDCAISYYKYGCALLYKAQEETDPLGNVPKNTPKNSEKDKTRTNIEDCGISKASASDAKQDNASSVNEEVEEGASDKDQEDDNEGSDGDGEELEEADEDESDLDLAWKMLDVARAIVEKDPEDTIEKVNILATLGEVAMEREDFETSLNDYLKALSILERLVEPDNRRIVELNFRISLVLEVGSKIEEAIPYCQKAISLCKSRLNRFTGVASSSSLGGNNANTLSDSQESGNQASEKAGTDAAILGNGEKELLGDILTELERKLEDLQQAMSNPKSVFSEIMKMVATRPASGEINLPSTEARSLSLTSSQMGAANGGFDSPTISTAATNGGITHLGIVGRGVKRASLNPIGAEPTQKRTPLDSSSEKDSSSTSGVTDSAAQDAENPTE